jgi:hypothetical protein
LTYSKALGSIVGFALTVFTVSKEDICRGGNEADLSLF